MGESIIRVRNLSKRFIVSRQAGVGRYAVLGAVVSNRIKKLLKGGDKLKSEEFWALRDLNFDVHTGDRIGIIGRNGAGKSTLLKILSRITEPTIGEIRLNGRVASLLEVGTGFHPELTGRENIFLNGSILGMSRREIKEKFDEIVSFAEVEFFLDTPVKRYSSGMYVRLAFSVAAHLDPEILIVDEVLAVGDAQFQKKCLGKMEDVSNSQGRTVIFVSHNMGVMKHLCNKGLFLENGSVKKEGDIQSVILAYSKSFVDNKTTYSHIAGTQRIKIDKISIGQANGIEIFNKIKVEILFSSSENKVNQEEGIHFFILFYNDEGEVILSVFQKDSEKMSMAGRSSVCVQVENILPPGRYMVSAGISDKSNQFVDWVERAESFDVLPVFDNGTSFDHRYGKTTLKALWK
jgi:lipopolysaccharide transport system ATP-binding protein